MDAHTLIHVGHILFLGPLLFAIGVEVPWISTQIIGWIGVGMVLYHAFKAYTKYQANLSMWVNIFHITYVAPALLAIGYYGPQAPRYLREIVLMFAFATVGYHAYYLLRPSAA